MKKFLYAGVLVGTFLLAGCNGNGELVGKVKEVMIEDLTDAQTLEDKSLVDDVKEEMVSKAPLELSQEQKEDYYKQYVEIIDVVMGEYPGTVMEVVPFEDIEDWIAPEEFIELAVERANAKFEVN